MLTQDEVVAVFEQNKQDAIRAARRVAEVSRAEAEDAYQNAVLYALGREYEELTESYVKQLVINRARDVERSERQRRTNRETAVGTPDTLSIIEAEAFARRTGRIRPVWAPEATKTPPPWDLDRRQERK